MPSPLEGAFEANLLTKKFHHLEAGDRINFACDMCGGCCKNTVVFLNSYDLLALTRFMGTTTAELLDNGIIEMFFSPTTGSPRCAFSFQAISKGEEFCPFLTPVDDPSTLAVPFDWTVWEKSRKALLKSPPEMLSGKLLGCLVHPARPTVCRSYPLGRVLVTDLKVGTQEAEIVLQEPDSYCKGHQTDKEIIVGDWLEESRCWQYWEANDLFMGILARLEASGFGQDMVNPDSSKESIPAPWPEDLFRLVFAVLYEFDETPFLKNEFPLSAIQGDHVTDMQALMRIGEIVDLLIDLKKSLERGNSIKARKLQGLVYSLIGEP